MSRVPGAPLQRCTRRFAAFAASNSDRSSAKTSTTGSVGRRGAQSAGEAARTYSTPGGSASSAGWPVAPMTVPTKTSPSGGAATTVPATTTSGATLAMGCSEYWTMILKDEKESNRLR